jgi:hypothetical protein
MPEEESVHQLEITYGTQRLYKVVSDMAANIAAAILILFPVVVLR